MLLSRYGTPAFAVRGSFVLYGGISLFISPTRTHTFVVGRDTLHPFPFTFVTLEVPRRPHRPILGAWGLGAWSRHGREEALKNLKTLARDFV